MKVEIYNKENGNADSLRPNQERIGAEGNANNIADRIKKQANELKAIL
jgi:hypothetical protein